MQSVNRFLDELYGINEAKNGMIVVKVTFDDKDHLITSINGTLEDAKKYYIGQTFVKYEDEETGKEYKHKAIKVEQVDGLNESEKLVAKNEKKGTEIYFDANTQTYNVYRDGKFIIGNKHKYSQVQTYVESILDESMDDEVHTFHSPMDMFRQIVKESQALYVKEKDGKIEGRYNPKPKKDWILVDGLTANKAVKLYNAASDEQKAKIDKVSLTRFLNVIWK